MMEGLVGKPELVSYIHDPEAQRSIRGWVGGSTHWRILEGLTGMLDKHQVNGGACEIGVFEGKYMIALHNSCGYGERSLAIDLFKDEYSVVKDGYEGSFRSNIERYCREPELVTVLKTDSHSLKGDSLSRVKNDFAKFRIFSIDGGHEPNDVLHDLGIATELCSLSGIIVIDDLFSLGFPGVVEGTVKYLTNNPSWVPLIISWKKLYLCHCSVYETYFLELQGVRKLFTNGKSTSFLNFMGSKCLCVDERS